MTAWRLNRFARAAARGAVFAYPTDTIWGLGCHPLIESSVMRILDIKQRPAGKGLILLASRLEYCRTYIDLDDDAVQPMAEPVSCPTTWLVPASAFCPPWLHGEHPTIAIRITDHPFAQALSDRLEAPLVSTSANRSGRANARSALKIRREFGAELDFIATGFPSGTGRPSEIKSLLTGEITRSSR